jgi:hypothetical protein
VRCARLMASTAGGSNASVTSVIRQSTVTR